MGGLTRRHRASVEVVIEGIGGSTRPGPLPTLIAELLHRAPGGDTVR